jgi:hypothetical protein
MSDKICYAVPMKTAGEIASALFDEQFIKKAQGYSKLFNSWEEITAKNGIASAAAHSRIKDLDRGILLVETDHPGWKQILQTKQTDMLNDFRRRFPDMEILGISLILGFSKAEEENESEKDTAMTEAEIYEKPPAHEVPSAQDFDSIQDEGFKQTLLKLGQSISDREKVIVNK